MSGPVVKRAAKKKLDPEAEALGASTDELNIKLEAAAEKLRGMGLGVEASVELTSWTDEHGSVEGGTVLLFGKRGNTWELLLQSWMDGETVGEPTAVTSGSRELRIQAALKLNELVSELRNKVREERVRVEKANAAIDAFLASDVADE